MGSEPIPNSSTSGTGQLLGTEGVVMKGYSKVAHIQEKPQSMDLFCVSPCPIAADETALVLVGGFRAENFSDGAS